jgi:hypothetical protein
MMTNDSKDQGREAFEAWWESLPGATGVEADKDYEADVKGWALMSWKAALTTSASALARDEVGELCARCNCWVRPSDDCNLCRSADDAKPVGEAVSVALSDERIIDIWCNTPTTRFGGEVEDQEIIDFARDEASVSEGWTSVEERLPKFPSTVLVAYESDADGEPCLDTGEAILHADGKWYGLGVFYALGREPRYEPRLTEKKVVCWKPMPSYSAPHATETVEMTDNSGWYEMAEWAVERWNAEVKNRPLINVHRRSLDDVWRQVIRHCGGDPDVLIGPNHDALLAASSAATVSDAASVPHWHGSHVQSGPVTITTTAGTQDERAAFETWAKEQGYRFNEGDLRNAKSWALAAWMARAATQQAESSTGICFFCGEPMNGEHESDCPQKARAASSATAPLTSDSEANQTLPQHAMPAWRDVVRERRRQIGVEGWTPEHDDGHDAGSLAAAGSAYAIAAADKLHPYSQGDADFYRQPPDAWPWHFKWWKPKDPRTALVKAGALILAEIERIDRAQSTNGEQS